MTDIFPEVVAPGGSTSALAHGTVSAGIDVQARRWKAIVSIVIGAAVIALAIYGLRHLVAHSHSPGRQVARIALLPDTPPPPPPKIEKKEEPKVDKLAPQPQDKPKDRPPEAVALKMEGAAGDAPSAFQAGTVTQDYRGGTPVVGGTGETTGLDRAQQRLYAGSVRQALHDELERQLGPEAPDVDAQVAVWITPEGRIARFELQGSPAERPPELQTAMQRVADALQLPSPPAIAQPMRFRLSLHAAG